MFGKIEGNSQEKGKVELFDALWEEALTRPDGEIEYRGAYPKHEFLDYIVLNKKVLLHGSNSGDIQELKPHQANCLSKKFGNLLGVYAMEDSVIPIFHAIVDRERFLFESRSGYRSDVERGAGIVAKKYDFALSVQMLREKGFRAGCVYILSRDFFEQGTNDAGEPIDEFISRTPVKPLAKLRVEKDDFPCLADIKPLADARFSMRDGVQK